MQPLLNLFLALAAVAYTIADCVNKEYDQCGGKDFPGDTCCPDYDECIYKNPYYSQCIPKDICLTPDYGQCNGTVHTPGEPDHPVDPKHHQCCPASFTCTYQNEWYSQCKPTPDPSSPCGQPYS